ncbi:MAG: hypothetical protein M1827_007632 [Pycnora praestabilis]|nr:MAG: hypothetical protein M1827_007632 [Pycnora praestabilis]
MIELISARGNTSLESAVSLTKALRWDIQALGLRLGKAANSEELTRRRSSKAKSRAENDIELKSIIQDIRKLLERIEDAVPLINLAITTSGASLSTNMPATISPSRLLQASTFLTAGDTQFSLSSGQPVQVGPAFTLSMYMLFSGHSLRPQDEEGVREATWKEVIHKARVKLVRVPLEVAYNVPSTATSPQGQQHTNSNYPSSPRHNPGTSDDYVPPHIAGQSKADEFAYRLVIIEDLNDDRVHTVDDEGAQPGPYEDVHLAGIREIVPIHEISKIFYADTGKILNIGNEGESNSPVLLLKRDTDAIPPRRTMEKVERENGWYEEEDSCDGEDGTLSIPREGNSQSELDAQLLREEHSSFVLVPQTEESPYRPDPWQLPPNLDPDWLAFEVYTEPEDSDSESEPEASDPDSSPYPPPTRSSREDSIDPNLTTALSHLYVHNPPIPSTPNRSPSSRYDLISSQSQPPSHFTPIPTPSIGPIRTSLSLLETLIRLTALQQFQQTSHLAINDELLNFFLEESSTTGAGGDGEERRRKREMARRRVGFDPYDESPVKRRGEGYQMQHGGTQAESQWGGSQSDGTLGRDVDHGHYPSRENTPATSPLLLRNHADPSRAATPEQSTPAPAPTPSLASKGPCYTPPSPFSPVELTKGRQAFMRRDTGAKGKPGSRLGRSITVEEREEEDSTRGSSPSAGKGERGMEGEEGEG